MEAVSAKNSKLGLMQEKRALLKRLKECEDLLSKTTAWIFETPSRGCASEEQYNTWVDLKQRVEKYNETYQKIIL